MNTRRSLGSVAAAAVRGLVLAACAATTSASAQGADGRALVAARLLPGETMRIDGRLDHAAWQRAPVHDDFVEKFPDTGGVPRHATRVQVLFDEHALYFGVRALDPEPSRIRAPLVRHDGVNRTQDFVVVYVDAIGQRQSAQFFRVNAAGSTADGMHTAADDSEDFAPDFDFEAASARDDQGWTAVLRIPFASLRFAGGGAQGWRAMVARRVPREQFHLTSSVLIPREAPSFIATLQPLQGVELPRQHQFLTLRPSLTWRVRRDDPGAGAGATRHDFDASLDLKWRPRPEWVIDATLRPDFSQVALDVPQLAGNTRFALSFPEKRPFFFESSDLLRSPSEAFYTRSFTEPRWGLRSTWRGRGVAGSVFAVDDIGGGQVLLPGAFATGVAEQPASASLAARAIADLGRWQLGVLGVDRRYDGRGDNRVAGPDLGWQIDDAFRLRAQWLRAETTALPDAAGQLRRGDRAMAGHRALLRLNWQGTRNDAFVAVDRIDEGFRHDTGFVNQAGVRKVEAGVSHGWLRVRPLNEIWLNLRAEQAVTTNGGLRVARDVYPMLWMGGPHNLDASIGWHGDAQTRVEAGSALLRQRFWKADLTVTPASWVPLLTASTRWGRLVDVLADTVRPGGEFSVVMSMRPLVRLELEPRWSIARLDKDGSQTYRESAAQVLGVWHFSARQTLRAIVQHTTIERRAEPGVAAASDVQTTGSLTWAWRRSAGTVMYVGASHGRRGQADPSHASEAFVKLQVDLDDLRAAL